jgi:hypothetical protein
MNYVLLVLAIFAIGISAYFIVKKMKDGGSVSENMNESANENMNETLKNNGVYAISVGNDFLSAEVGSEKGNQLTMSGDNNQHWKLIMSSPNSVQIQSAANPSLNVQGDTTLGKDIQKVSINHVEGNKFLIMKNATLADNFSTATLQYKKGDSSPTWVGDSLNPTLWEFNKVPAN